MALTRKVRIRQGYGDVFQDGVRYGPGQELGVTEETYQALQARFELIDTAPEIAEAEAEAASAEVPDELQGITAADLRAMTRDELRALAHAVGAKSASGSKDKLVDALVAMLPEEAR